MLARPLPLIVTWVPAWPLVGLKELIFGAGGRTRIGLLAWPPGVVTTRSPWPLAEGVVAVSLLSETLLKLTLVPLIVTALAPLRCVPVTVTSVPPSGCPGKTELIVGGGTVTTKLPALTTPVGKTTLNEPVVAPAGTARMRTD